MRALNWIAFLFLISFVSGEFVYAKEEQTVSLQTTTSLASSKEVATKENSANSKKKSRRHYSHHSKSEDTREVINKNSEGEVSTKESPQSSAVNSENEVEQEENFELVFPGISLSWFPKVRMYLSGSNKMNQSRSLKTFDFRGWLNIPIIPDLVAAWNSFMGGAESEQEEENTEEEESNEEEAAEEEEAPDSEAIEEENAEEEPTEEAADEIEDANDGDDEGDGGDIPTIPDSGANDAGLEGQPGVNNADFGVSTFASSTQTNAVSANSVSEQDEAEMKKLSEENKSLKEQTNNLQNTITKLRRKYLRLRERSASDSDINLGDAEAIRRAMKKLKSKRLLLNYPLGTCAVCNRTLAPLSTLIPNSNSGVCVYCANIAIRSAGHNKDYDLLFGGDSSNGYSTSGSSSSSSGANNGINGYVDGSSQFEGNPLNNEGGRNGVLSRASGSTDFDQDFSGAGDDSSFGRGSGGELMGNILGTALNGGSGGGGLMGNLLGTALKGGIAGLLSGDDKDSNNKVSSDTMVFDANGKLVPLRSLEGTSTPYGYVMNASKVWVPASSLAEGISAPNSTYVLDANGNKVLLSSMANTSTPYGYVRNPDGTISPATTLAQGVQAAGSAVGAGMIGAGANQMVYNANGQLVPVSSLAGTIAPYGYIRDANGMWVPASSLAQGVQAAGGAAGMAAANKKVFDATGKLVPISSLVGSNAPYGYVMKNGVWVPASSEAEGLNAINSTYVMDASGNKVLLATMAGTNTPFGYVRNPDGTLAPAISVTQAVKSAASTPNAVNTASNVMNTALTSATTLATTLAALKSIAPARDPNSSVSGLFNRSDSNLSNSQEGDQAREKSRLEKRYKDLETQIRRQENTVQKNQTALDKAKQLLENAKTALQGAQQKVSSAKTDREKKNAENGVTRAQNNVNMKQTDFDKKQQTLDSSKQRLEDLKTEYQEAQSEYQRAIGM